MLRDKITRNSFIRRFSAFNICGIAVLLVACIEGWVGQLLAADSTSVTTFIGMTFVYGLLLSIWRAMGLNLIANHVPGLLKRMHMTPSTIGLRITAEIQAIQNFAYLLLFEGAAGILIGMIHSNMQMAASIGLLGMLGHIWLITNYNMMSTLRQRIIASMMEQYERVV